MGVADLLLHPVRLRIVQCLLGDRALTTADLRAELPDVPAATLYRQVATLHDGQVLEVVDERRVRGALERTYRLTGSLVVDADEAAAMSREEHGRAFLGFVAGLLGDFERYLARDDIDLARDNVGYRQNALYLSDEELAEFVEDLTRVVLPRAGLGPAEGRRRRMFSTILMPGENPGG